MCFFALQAYKKWATKNPSEPGLPGLDYSHEQLFFINFAQTYCMKAKDEFIRSRLITDVHSYDPFR